LLDDVFDDIGFMVFFLVYFGTDIFGLEIIFDIFISN